MATVTRGSKTTLRFGVLECPVALYKTMGEEKDPKYDAAGPNGGKLRVRQNAQEAAPADTPVADPLDVVAPDPGREAGDGGFSPLPDGPPPRAQTAPGEFRRELVEEDTGVVVLPDDIRRGVRREDGTFVDLTEGLAQIDEATKLKEMRVDDFIRVEDVPRERVLGSYYLAPDGQGAPKIIRLLHEAMRAERLVAVVKWTKTKRQALGVLVPARRGKGVLVLELGWAEDWHEPNARILSPAQAEVTEEEVASARELVSVLRGKRSETLDEMRDDARRLRAELLAAAERGEAGAFAVPAAPKAAPAESLEEQLRRSVDLAAA